MTFSNEMPSEISVDKRRRTYVRLIGEISHSLNEALAEENARRQLTQTGMAEALQTNKSFVSRKMSGLSNMTLETLADLAFALDRIVKIQLVPRSLPAGSNATLSEGAGPSSQNYREIDGRRSASSATASSTAHGVFQKIPEPA